MRVFTKNEVFSTCYISDCMIARKNGYVPCLEFLFLFQTIHSKSTRKIFGRSIQSPKTVNPYKKSKIYFESSEAKFSLCVYVHVYMYTYMIMYLYTTYIWICIFNWIYLSEHDFQVKMMLSEDGSGRGAALVAAVAHRMRVARSSVSSES